MSFKAEDFEKKMGQCPRHGEQVLWLACKHVAKQANHVVLKSIDADVVSLRSHRNDS